MIYLVKRMEVEMDIFFVKISFVGVEDIKNLLFRIVSLFDDEEMIVKVKVLIKEEEEKVLLLINVYKENLKGKKVVIYVGGGFKVIFLIK